MCAIGGEKSTLDAIPNCSTPCTLKQGLLLKVKLTNSSRLCSQLIHRSLCPPSDCQDYRWLSCPSAIYMGPMIPNLFLTLAWEMLYSMSHFLVSSKFTQLKKMNKIPCLSLPSILYLCWLSIFHFSISYDVPPNHPNMVSVFIVPSKSALAISPNSIAL